MSNFFYNSTALSNDAYVRTYDHTATEGGDKGDVKWITRLDAYLDMLKALDAGTVTVDGAQSPDAATRETANKILSMLGSFKGCLSSGKERRLSAKDVHFPMGRPFGFTDKDVTRVVSLMYDLDLLRIYNGDPSELSKMYDGIKRIFSPDSEVNEEQVKNIMEHEMKKCCCTGMASYIGLNRKENGEKPDTHVCKNIGVSKDNTPIYHGIGAAAMNEASSIINGARNEQYGKPEDCFAAIAGAWSSLIGHSFTPRDVARMMIVLKCVRDSHQSKHDNMVDAIGYAAIASELD